MSWQPITEVGDVVIHHVRPKVWLPSRVARAGEVDGKATTVRASRMAAVDVAQTLRSPTGRIYIRHHDDAEWEEVMV